jgi:hypothetical protein
MLLRLINAFSCLGLCFQHTKVDIANHSTNMEQVDVQQAEQQHQQLMDELLQSPHQLKHPDAVADKSGPYIEPGTNRGANGLA